MEIKKIDKQNLHNAISLIWKTFLKFEAPDYSNEGINEFKECINNKSWIEEREIFGAYKDNKLVGVIATKDKTHIALFFVDEQYQGMGIGKKLFEYVKSLNNKNRFTVNSSLYAKDIYLHMGFIDTAEEQCINGIKFIPMEFKF